MSFEMKVMWYIHFLYTVSSRVLQFNSRQTSSNMRLRDDDMDRYRPPACLQEGTQNTHLKVTTHTRRGNLHCEINTRETTTRLKDGVTLSLVKTIRENQTAVTGQSSGEAGFCITSCDPTGPPAGTGTFYNHNNANRKSCLPAGLRLQRVVRQRVGVEVQRFGVLQQLDAVSLRPTPRARILRFCWTKQNNSRVLILFYKPRVREVSGAAGGPTSVVAGRHRVRVAGLLHFMAAPVPRRVVFSRVPITLLPLLQHTDPDHVERVLQTFSLISKWIYGSWFLTLAPPCGDCGLCPAECFTAGPVRTS